ncbi:MAG: sulfite exporter TauE/SafE family protein, partial [Planctomycetota bacterium]
MTEPRSGRPRRGRGPLLLLSAAAIAFVGAICGIGGGLFAVPLLHYVFRLGLRATVATSLCLVWANALASTGAELLHAESAFEWRVVLPLVGGALVGAQFGYLASIRLPQRAIKGIFAAVMAAAGLRLLLAASGSAEGTAFPIEYGVPRASAVAAIGVLAGAASPLLGIGGGLIVVPGILLVLPELGMLGARAAALGNAVVTSSRSIQLYAKEGAIDWKLARWIVVGAFAGATLGVQVVHLEGAAALGRSALSFLLVVTALRM